MTGLSKHSSGGTDLLDRKSVTSLAMLEDFFYLLSTAKDRARRMLSVRMFFQVDIVQCPNARSITWWIA
jgi:hypothetical protein